MSEKDVEAVKKFYGFLLPKFKDNVKSKEGLTPVAFTSSGVIIGLIFRDTNEKIAGLDALNKALEANKDTWLLYASEAWMVTVQAKTEEEALAERRKLPKSLENAPGRKEVLIVLLMTHGWHEGHGFEIIRDGEKVTFGEEVNYADDELVRYRLTYFKQKRDYDKMI